MLWADVGSWLAPRRSATLDETNECEDDHARISSQVRVRLEASRIPGLVTEVFALTSSRVELPSTRHAQLAVLGACMY